MSREQSDGEGSMGETGTDSFVDSTAETEVELRLPLEVDMEPDQIRKDVPINLVAVNLDDVDPDPETLRRFGPPNRATPKWPRHGFPTLPPLGNPMGSYRGRGTTGRVQRLSTQVRNVQSSVFNSLHNADRMLG